LFLLFLRFYKLGSLLSLFGDEVDIGYQAYSLLKTGKDVIGHLLPIYLDTIIDTKTPLLAYFSTVPIFFLGLNEFSIRLIPAVCGSLSILLIFLISEELFENKMVSLFSALVMASTPWMIHYSRGTFEMSLMFFFTSFGNLHFF